MSIYDGKLSLSATVASGIEAVTKRELIGLGLNPSPAINGRICFDGDFLEIGRANMFLRTANRVFINIAEFKAETFDELFDNLYSINWEDIIPKDAKILINAKSFKSNLFALSSIQKISKKAIVERLKVKHNLTYMPETGICYNIDISLAENIALVALDTSGDGLHKRGYRPIMGLAPMKETLASAIILLSVWNHDRTLVDCFCGSGTIPIEASLIGTNTAPGLSREFAFENFLNAPIIIDKVREEALDMQKLDRKLRISGFDIDKESIKMAMIHAKNANMENYIHFQNLDMKEVSSRFSHGVIISNLPFGERLLKERALISLYREFGKMYRSLDEWCCYAFTSYPNFEKHFGLRASKKRKLYSSQLECVLYQYLARPPKRLK